MRDGRKRVSFTLIWMPNQSLDANLFPNRKFFSHRTYNRQKGMKAGDRQTDNEFPTSDFMMKRIEFIVFDFELTKFSIFSQSVFYCCAQQNHPWTVHCGTAITLLSLGTSAKGGKKRCKLFYGKLPSKEMDAEFRCKHFKSIQILCGPNREHDKSYERLRRWVYLFPYDWLHLLRITTSQPCSTSTLTLVFVCAPIHT